ncbi:GNAT family N-acetyltransferase [Streptomyces pactum]|uniref:GNAT family N-acetyltransferase n=1 Tax=Streptomyces pactum TaxID=68249 RepID=A0ABS0NJN5_9ACTN|nr:GNAT family protein [Streptomyces pactum]MBH5335409.1 GNAT family N-acetyltransferase [Streptomyces pactum]
MDVPTVTVAAGVRLRPLVPEDAGALCDAYVRNREHLRRWEPVRAARFHTPEGQADRIRDQLAQQAEGRLAAWVLDDGERIVGTATLNSIVLGPLRSASLGYWIDGGLTGRGLATAATLAVLGIADERLGLHRVEASTHVANTASQRVLAKCGFERIGLAPRYLHINGEWADHILFQHILNDRRPPG